MRDPCLYINVQSHKQLQNINAWLRDKNISSFNIKKKSRLNIIKSRFHLDNSFKEMTNHRRHVLTKLCRERQYAPGVLNPEQRHPSGDLTSLSFTQDRLIVQLTTCSLAHTRFAVFRHCSLYRRWTSQTGMKSNSIETEFMWYRMSRVYYISSTTSLIYLPDDF